MRLRRRFSATRRKTGGGSAARVPRLAFLLRVLALAAGLAVLPAAADAIAKLLPVTGAWYVVDYNLCLHKLEAKDDKPERYFNSVYVNQIAKM